MKTMRMGHLLPGPIARRGLEYAFEARALQGLRQLAGAWDGDLVVLVPEGEAPWPSIGSSAVAEADEPFSIQVIPRKAEAIDGLGLDVFTALHSPQMQFVTGADTPLVLTSEVTMGIRRGIHTSYLSGLNNVRAQAGLLRMERALRQQMKSARSAQFNGPAAATAYRKFAPDGIMFHDHRVTARDVEASSASRGWDGTGPLRMAFSGRLDRIKGPEYAVRLANEAHAAGLPVELHVFGVGPLEAELRSMASQAVHFRGFKDFHSEWLPIVRDEIDLMVLPHVQGDPSCTYFEALGSGAPVMGFRNETLTPLVEKHAIGWACPRGEVQPMLERLTTILDDPTQLHQARANGLNLLRSNTFEVTTARRARHIQSVTY